MKTIILCALSLVLMSCTAAKMYDTNIRDLKDQAKKKYGEDHKYQYDFMVGDIKVWQGVGCHEFNNSDVSGVTSKNTFVGIYTYLDGAMKDMLEKCSRRVSPSKCIPIVEMNNCLLDQQSNYLETQTKNEMLSEMEDGKKKCMQLGFTAGTEAFGNCVLKLMK